MCVYQARRNEFESEGAQKLAMRVGLFGWALGPSPVGGSGGFHPPENLENLDTL